MFRTVQRVRASDQVAKEVADRILDGDLMPGDKLPAERDLAEQFQVNRSTVREAIKSLTDLGLVVARHGDGTVVQDYVRRAGIQLLPHMFLRGDKNRDLLRSVLESRRVFAVEVTRLAAGRATAKDLVALKKILEEMVRAGGDLPRFQALDYDFVLTLTEASKNWVFRLVSNSVRWIYEERPELFVALVRDPKRVVAGYRAALNALEKGNGERAAREIDKVMRAGEKQLEKSLGLRPRPRSQGRREKS